MRRVRVSADGRELEGLVAEALGAASTTAGGRAGGRRVLGIAGAPGAGKTTLAAHVARLAGAASLPMDGFHLADVELVRRGLRDRKGAPETFDAAGFSALLRRVRAGEDDVVAPAFERGLEQPLAGAIAVPAQGPVVVEGNYLLLDDARWRPVRGLFDAAWHVVVDDALRLERLVARHERFGKAPDVARAWVDRVDQPNARLVDAAAHRADVVVDLTAWVPPPG